MGLRESTKTAKNLISALTMEHSVTAEKKVSLSYRNQTDEGRRNAAESRKCQHLQNIRKDEDFQFGFFQTTVVISVDEKSI